MKRKRNSIVFPVSLLICFFVVLLVILAAIRIGQDTASRQTESLTTALQKDITNCYALEGFYPPDLQYMKDHYGLVYDESAYIVDYQPVASNIRPTFTVIQISR